MKLLKIMDEQDFQNWLSKDQIILQEFISFAKSENLILDYSEESLIDLEKWLLARYEDCDPTEKFDQEIILDAAGRYLGKFMALNTQLDWECDFSNRGHIRHGIPFFKHKHFTIDYIPHHYITAACDRKIGNYIHKYALKALSEWRKDMHISEIKVSNKEDPPLKKYLETEPKLLKLTDQDDSEYWRFRNGFIIDDFLDFLSIEKGVELQRDLNSIHKLEKWLKETYKSEQDILTFDQHNILDGCSRYVGRVISQLTQLPVGCDFSDQEDENYGLPYADYSPKYYPSRKILESFSHANDNYLVESILKLQKP